MHNLLHVELSILQYYPKTVSAYTSAGKPS